jgi:hypothetical protein
MLRYLEVAGPAVPLSEENVERKQADKPNESCLNLINTVKVILCTAEVIFVKEMLSLLTLYNGFFLQFYKTF